MADISAHGRYVPPKLHSAYRDIDLKQDLGLENESLLQMRLSWRPNPTKEFRIESFDTYYHGQGLVRYRYIFEFTAQTKEEMHLAYQRVVWINYGKPQAKQKLQTAFLYDIKRAAMRGTGEASVTTHNSTHPSEYRGAYSWQGMMPTIGAAAVYQLDANSRINVEASGITTGSKGFSFLDWKADGELLLGHKSNTSVVLGYRSIAYKNMRQTDDSKLAAVKIAGYYWGVKVRM